MLRWLVARIGDGALGGRHANAKARATAGFLGDFPPGFLSARHVLLGPRRIWRKRVGVEPTILAAKDRIHGFEGHESHRTSFASELFARHRSRDHASPAFGGLSESRTSFASELFARQRSWDHASPNHSAQAGLLSPPSRIIAACGKPVAGAEPLLVDEPGTNETSRDNRRQSFGETAEIFLRARSRSFTSVQTS